MVHDLHMPEHVAHIRTVLAQARREAGLSQRQLGELLGVSKQLISHWETSGSKPSYDQLARWARALGWSLDVHLKPGTDDGRVEVRLLPTTVALALAADRLGPEAQRLVRRLVDVIEHLDEWDSEILGAHWRPYATVPVSN